MLFERRILTDKHQPMIGGMTYELCFLPHHKCYTSGQNCTRLTHEEISEYYTDEDKK